MGVCKTVEKLLLNHHSFWSDTGVPRYKYFKYLYLIPRMSDMLRIMKKYLLGMKHSAMKMHCNFALQHGFCLYKDICIYECQVFMSSY